MHRLTILNTRTCLTGESSVARWAGTGVCLEGVFTGSAMLTRATLALVRLCKCKSHHSK